MTAIEELNELLSAMPEKERERIASVLLDVIKSQEWDTQIEEDALSGKLDDLIQKAKAAHRNGKTSAIPS